MKSIVQLRVGIVLLSALAWCGLLLVVRTLWTWSLDYAFLVWNLGLAVIPLLLSSLIVWQQHSAIRFGLSFLWLLFLPNAPYMITDFIHLRALDSGPLWLDVLLVSSCSATGLAFGYCSLIQIHSLFTQAQRPGLGWIVSAGALFMCGFGIYLGRFLRWRTIDVFNNPFALLGDVTDRVLNPWLHCRAWGVTLGFGFFLFLGYALLTFMGMANKAMDRTAHSPSSGHPL